MFRRFMYNTNVQYNLVYSQYCYPIIVIVVSFKEEQKKKDKLPDLFASCVMSFSFSFILPPSFSSCISNINYPDSVSSSDFQSRLDFDGDHGDVRRLEQ